MPLPTIKEESSAQGALYTLLVGTENSAFASIDLVKAAMDRLSEAHPDASRIDIVMLIINTMVARSEGFYQDESDSDKLILRSRASLDVFSSIIYSVLLSEVKAKNITWNDIFSIPGKMDFRSNLHTSIGRVMRQLKALPEAEEAKAFVEAGLLDPTSLYHTGLANKTNHLNEPPSVSEASLLRSLDLSTAEKMKTAADISEAARNFIASGVRKTGGQFHMLWGTPPKGLSREAYQSHQDEGRKAFGRGHRLFNELAKGSSLDEKLAILREKYMLGEESYNHDAAMLMSSDLYSDDQANRPLCLAICLVALEKEGGSPDRFLEEHLDMYLDEGADGPSPDVIESLIKAFKEQSGPIFGASEGGLAESQRSPWLILFLRAPHSEAVPCRGCWQRLFPFQLNDICSIMPSLGRYCPYLTRPETANDSGLWR